jgi:hypothetical protein
MNMNIEPEKAVLCRDIQNVAVQCLFPFRRRARSATLYRILSMRANGAAAKIKPILNLFKPEIKNQTEIRPNQTKNCGSHAPAGDSRLCRDTQNSRPADVFAPVLFVSSVPFACQPVVLPSSSSYPASLDVNFDNYPENTLIFNTRQIPLNPAILLQFARHPISPLKYYGSILYMISADESASKFNSKTRCVSHCLSTVLEVNIG